jgi:methionyl-tRNA formyltransferase
MDEGLDTGGIIERKQFRIEPKATQQQVLVETAMIGSRLIQKAARKLLRGEKIIPIDVSGEKENYYAMPTQQDFKHYFRKNGYFRIRDLLRIISNGVKKRRLRKKRRLAT